MVIEPIWNLPLVADKSFFEGANKLEEVHVRTSFHDFQICTLHVDVDFRNDAYIVTKLSPAWFDLPDDGWTSNWVTGIVKLSRVRSFLGANLHTLDEGPASVMHSSFEEIDGLTSFLLTLSANRHADAAEPKLAFSFESNGYVKFMSNAGHPLTMSSAAQ